MIMRFEFATATRILFGAGAIEKSGKIITDLGRRALVVTGSSPDRSKPFLNVLCEHGVEHHLFSIDGEPTVSVVEQGKRYADQEKCDLVIGFGGGSALDAGKAIAILVANPGDINNYLEVIGRSQPFVNPSIPYIAIPTTAGTGTEVTRNAVLGSKEHRIKVSLRSPSMLPRLAIVDPQLTYNLPAQITAFSGMDALTQLIESFVSNKANPLTDAFCREGAKRVARSLERAFVDGTDAAAREDMSLASLMGGLALANAKLGAVHGFAGPMGGMYDAPHGAICARLLAPVILVNIIALHERQPESEALQRYTELATILTGNNSSRPEDGIAWVERVTKKFEIPPLSYWGIKEDEFEVLIEKAAVASSMGGNPIKLTVKEMRQIIDKAI
jgi:alcohol dehydrogenase class IV